MITVLKNYNIQCDACKAYLSYDEDDIYVSFNWLHTHILHYLNCPKCDNDICIEQFENEKA